MLASSFSSSNGGFGNSSTIQAVRYFGCKTLGCFVGAIFFLCCCRSVDFVVRAHGSAQQFFIIAVVVFFVS